MRIEACTALGNSIQLVWHCEQCRKVVFEWVDTDTAEYCELVRRDMARRRQARSIVFDEQALVIYINPIDDVDIERADQLETTA